MSVNLQKGQKVNLRKDNGDKLRRVMVGLGWDEVQQKKKLFGPKPQDVDCDAAAFLCIDGHVRSVDDIVYFGNLTHRTNCVTHMGDNLTGAGVAAGDDEQIMVDLDALPMEYDKVIIIVNIYQAQKRGQHFGMVQNAFIRVCDCETGTEMCRYNLSENYDRMTSMVFGELYRKNGEWKFNAIGQGTTDDGIAILAQRFT